MIQDLPLPGRMNENDLLCSSPSLMSLAYLTKEETTILLARLIASPINGVSCLFSTGVPARTICSVPRLPL